MVSVWYDAFRSKIASVSGHLSWHQPVSVTSILFPCPSLGKRTVRDGAELFVDAGKNEGLDGVQATGVG